MDKQAKYLFLLIMGLFVLIISPHLLSKGMFMDGLIYASISKNLSEGIGSTWDLVFTQTSGPFRGHPPLVMLLESLFFKLFGSAHYIEKLFSFLCIIITSLISVSIFIKLVDKSKQAYYPLVLFFFICCPIILWSSTNNMLENAMMIFTTLSFWFFIHLDKKYLLFSFVGGVLVYVAFLCKGVVALFPFSIPFWYWIYRGVSLNKGLAMLSISIIGFSVSALLVHLIMPQSTEFFKIYFEQQIVGSLENGETVNSRFLILWFFISNIAIGLLITTLLSLKNLRVLMSKNALLSLSIALSAIVPMMISLKQSEFYILASLPFVGISFAIIASESIGKLLIKIYKITYLKWISLGIVSISCLAVFSFKNSISRDRELIEDINNISLLTQNDSLINISLDINMDYATHGYFYRFHKKSIAVGIERNTKMIKANSKPNAKLQYKGHFYDLIEN